MIVRELLTLLGFKVDSKDLDRYGNALNRTRGLLGKVTSVAAKAAGVLAGVVVGTAAKGIWEANQQYDLLISKLETLEGDADKARAKFEELQGIAGNTPHQLTEVTEAYSRLKAAGFEASKGNIMALGDLATASGKSLGDVVEAMLSANRGLGSMVDNFNGLSASSKKGNLELKNAATGAKELVKAGDTKKLMEFFTAAGRGPGIAGAMDAQMKKLPGRISNLKDEMFKLYVAIGDAGLRDALGKLIGEFSKGVEGGQSLAGTIGGALAKGVNLLTEGLSWLKDNWELVAKGAAVALAAFKVAEWAVLIASFGGIKGAIAALIAAVAPFASTIATVIAPALAVVGALVGLSLILEDLYFYFTGGPSLIGRFIDKFAEGGGPLGGFASSLKNMLAKAQEFGNKLKELGARFLNGIAPNIIALKTLWDQGWNEIKAAAGDALNSVLVGLGMATDEGGSTFETLGQIAETVFPAVLSVANFVLGGIGWAFKGLIAVAGPVIRGLGFIFGGVLAVVGALVSTAVEGWLLIFQNIPVVWSWLVSAIVDAWNAAAAGITAGLNWITDTAFDAWQSFNNAANTAIDAVSAAVGDLIGLLTSGLSLLGQLAAGDISGVVDRVSNAVSGLTGNPAGGGPGALASATAGAGGGGSTNVNQSVAGAQVTVNVNSSNASPNDIGAAAASGTNAGTSSGLREANRNAGMG